MADICIVYAREDRVTAARLERVFAKYGWTVWWDEHIHHGQYRREIQHEIETGKVVVPLWSRHSVNRDWVLDEADLAKELKRPIHPIRLDGATLPLGFKQLQTSDLQGWKGSQSHRGLVKLCSVLEHALGKQDRPSVSAPTTLVVGPKAIQLPCFLRSVSSFETLLSPSSSLEALALLRSDAVLVSAYDVAKKTANGPMLELMNRLVQDDSLLVLDSGNYEASRRRDRKWSHENYARVAREAPSHLIMSFDVPKNSRSAKALTEDAVRAVRRDKKSSGSEHICPILHAPRKPDGRYDTAVLPDALFGVAERLAPPLVAIPERELGDGIIERMRTVWQIRKRLGELPFYQPLHLLGTGNPLSIALYSVAGADVFDGLEWCRTVVDHEHATLFHPQQYDLFSHQTGLLAGDIGLANVLKAAVGSPSLSYEAKLAFHNLEFFGAWIRELQGRRAAKTVDHLLAARLTKSFDKITSALPEVFQ